MKLAVVGAGAIGAFVGAVLTRAGEQVSLIARGPHLRAMQQGGVRLRSPLGEFTVQPPATDDPTEVGPVDVALLTLKAHSLPAMAPRLAPLLGPDTAVVTMQNGIPWWYFYRHGGEFEGLQLESVDPKGVIKKHIDPRRVIGCVVYCSAMIRQPGVVEHVEGLRFSIGEPDGSKSERCQQIADVFSHAGLRCPIRSDIRKEIWIKLLGNAAFNPISALARATVGELATFQETRALSLEIMREVEAVAHNLGVDLGISLEQRLAGAEALGDHKTSMLQDLEAGRSLELEPIVGVVLELGEKLGLSLPHTRSVYACAKLLNAGLNRKDNKSLYEKG